VKEVCNNYSSDSVKEYKKLGQENMKLTDEINQFNA